MKFKYISLAAFILVAASCSGPAENPKYKSNPLPDSFEELKISRKLSDINIPPSKMQKVNSDNNKAIYVFNYSSPFAPVLDYKFDKVSFETVDDKISRINVIFTHGDFNKIKNSIISKFGEPDKQCKTEVTQKIQYTDKDNKTAIKDGQTITFNSYRWVDKNISLQESIREQTADAPVIVSFYNEDGMSKAKTTCNNYK